MTAIVAYRTEDAIYVASDKRHNFAYGGYYDTANKFQCLQDNIHVFIAGNTLIHQAVRAVDLVQAETPVETMTHFVDELRSAISDKNLEEIDFALLVVFNDTIFVVSAKLDFTPVPSLTYGLGSGGDFAEGYFLALMDDAVERNIPVNEEVIFRAFKRAFALAASRYNNVSANFDFTRI